MKRRGAARGARGGSTKHRTVPSPPSSSSLASEDDNLSTHAPSSHHSSHKSASSDKVSMTPIPANTSFRARSCGGGGSYTRDDDRTSTNGSCSPVLKDISSGEFTTSSSTRHGPSDLPKPFFFSAAAASASPAAPHTRVKREKPAPRTSLLRQWLHVAQSLWPCPTTAGKASVESSMTPLMQWLLYTADGTPRAWTRVSSALSAHDQRVQLRHLRRFLSRALLAVIALVSAGILVWCCLQAVVSAPPPVPPWSSPLATVVQHRGAGQRVPLTVTGKVRRESLPSWTLHRVLRVCADCLERRDYEAAVRRAAADGMLSGREKPVVRNEGKEEEEEVDLTQDDETLRRRGAFGVFATPTAPLGRIGPFLFAVRSVTDDIDVVQELEGWSWIKPFALSDPSIPLPQRPLRRSYVAVMGIPTVDNIAHEQLRESQRRSWMQYGAVARSDNDFNAPLLPLYIFAAREPALTEAEADSDPSRVPQDEDVGLTVDAAALTPTMREFEGASAFYAFYESALPRQAADGGPVRGGPSYTQRQMALRDDWRMRRVWRSPCSHVVSTTVHMNARHPHMHTGKRRQLNNTNVDDHLQQYQQRQHEVGLRVLERRFGYVKPTLDVLQSRLRLPVAPAFTAAAQYVCAASAAAWQEALVYKNVLWIDMLTDRRPTSGKKAGQDGGWGLSVEVGMTQKLILWLQYAYHTFPDVPYIIKGDDDVYLKVPQWVRDMRYVHGGQSEHVEADLQFADANDKSTTGNDGQEVTGTGTKGKETTDCVYWGLLWGQHQKIPYFVGMQYLLDRRLARVLLDDDGWRAEKENTLSGGTAIAAETAERTASAPLSLFSGFRAFFSTPTAAPSVDLVRLAMLDFDDVYAPLYRAAGMNEEDLFVGRTLLERRAVAEKMCPSHRVRYIEEGSPRFHDLRRGYRSVVTWASVVVHRCLPADMYFLHYYFAHEHAYANVTGAFRGEAETAGFEGAVETTRTENEETAEQEAQARGAAWAKAHLDSRVVGWDDLQPVQWVAHGTIKAANRRKNVCDVVDDVAVYNVTLRPWQFNNLVEGGLMTVPHYKKKDSKYVLLE